MNNHELQELIQDIAKVPVIIYYRSPKIKAIKNYKSFNNNISKISTNINKAEIPKECLTLTKVQHEYKDPVTITKVTSTWDDEDECCDVDTTEHEAEKKNEKFNEHSEKFNGSDTNGYNPPFEKEKEKENPELQVMHEHKQDRINHEANIKNESTSEGHTRIDEINEILDKVFVEDSKDGKKVEENLSHLTKKEKKALEKQKKKELKLQKKYEKKTKNKSKENFDSPSTHTQNKEFINEFLGDVDDEEYEDFTGTGLLQLRAAERINKDGYYDMSRPYDVNLHEKPTINKAAFVVLGLCFVAIVILTVILFNMLF